VASLVAAPDARRRSIAGYAFALAIIPVVAVWLISRGPTSYWTFRYMLFSIAGWSVGAGVGIAYLADRFKQARLARFTRGLSPRFVAAAVLVAVVGLLGIHDQMAIRQNEAHNLWAYPEVPSNGQPADYQAAAGVIAAHARPGDGIVYQVSDDNHYQVDTAMSYYLRGKLPTAVFQAQTQVESNSLQPVECQDPAVPGCITGTPRLWVVFVDHLAPDPFSAMQPAQASLVTILGYQTQQTWQENGVTVALLTVG
jgi:mannosyltransferase